MANGLPTSTISHTGQTYLPPLQHDIREYIGGISNPALSILYPDSHQIPDGLVVTQEVVQVGSGGGVGWGGGADLFAWGHTACRFIIPCKCITTRSIKMSWYWLAHEFSSVCEIMKKSFRLTTVANTIYRTLLAFTAVIMEYQRRVDSPDMSSAFHVDAYSQRQNRQHWTGWHCWGIHRKEWKKKEVNFGTHWTVKSHQIITLTLKL